MSALGQRPVEGMSALPPKADIGTQSWNVRFVPKADILRRGKERRYSITSSAIDIMPAGMVRPSALAVVRLMTRSNLFDCSTGSSAGLAPLENAARVDADVTEHVCEIGSVAHQPADFHIIT